MRDLGVGTWIERRARETPERPALIRGARTYTYAQLARRVRRLAHGLQSLGVGRGDRVCWLGPNHPAFLETLFAAAKLGAITAPVSHLLSADGIAFLIDDCAPAVTVIESSLAQARLPRSAGARLIAGGSGVPPALEDLIEMSPDDPLDEPVDLTDVCLLPHTSGTTGRPKGVMLTHGNVTWNAVNVVTSSDVRADDVTIAVAPFFRVGGSGVNVLPLLFRGGTVVVPELPGVDEILRLIEAHRVTIGFGNPELLDALVAATGWTSRDLTSVRYFLTGGAPVPERLLRAFMLRGIPCLQGYGLSEAAPVVLLLSPEHALDRAGSAGTPLLFVDVRIARPDDTDCGPGETGELLVQGPNVMAGYWQLPAETERAVDPGGWLHSGDAARMDQDGFIRIVDRMKDGYPTSDGLVYPAEVEAVARSHQGVMDAGVVGVPTGTGQFETRIFAVRRSGDDVSELDVLDFCRRHAPRPMAITSVTWVGEVPRNSVGKVIRERLHDLAGPG